MDQCTKLTIVDVSSNSLISLASLETAKLPQLSELVANHNQLGSLPSEVASNWSAIKRFVWPFNRSFLRIFFVNCKFILYKLIMKVNVWGFQA